MAKIVGIVRKRVSEKEISAKSPAKIYILSKDDNHPGESYPDK